MYHFVALLTAARLPLDQPPQGEQSEACERYDVKL